MFNPALLKLRSLKSAWLVLVTVLFSAVTFSQTGAQIESRLDKVDHEKITLWSEGVRLQGDIYKPKNLPPGDKLPGILLVHGWGGVKQHLQRAYGPQFAELGFIVLAFDYKGWGDSDGHLLVPEAMAPIESSADLELKAKHIRKIVNPLSMVADARAALHYLAGEPQVMSNNIGVWGTSLGGGVALVTSANDDRVKAYVDQIGAVNFKANLDMITDGMVRRWETQRARGEITQYPGPEAAIIPGLKGFPDWIGMKNFDSLAYAEKLSIPTLIIDAEEEELFARDKNGLVLHQALKDRIETRYVTYPGKHYDMYRGDNYRNALRDAQDWFVTHLKGSAEGASLYKEKCALCHSNPQIRAPAYSVLKSMSEEKVLLAMTEGKMKQQAASLTDGQRSQLAKYLTAGVQDPRAWEATVACDANIGSKTSDAAVAGWGYGVENHRYQPEALAGFNAGDLPELELAWAQGFPGATEMRSQSVITDDTLYIGVQSSSAVYAFDLASGCLKWVHRGGPVRSALSFARLPDSNAPILFYGDANGAVHVIKATDGTEVWSKNIALDDIVITGTPVLHQQKLYVPLSTSEIGKTFNSKYECCKAHGGVVALDIRNGETLWTYETTEAAKPFGKNAVGTTMWGPSGAPIWTTPAIDAKRNRLYIGTGENYSHPATQTSDAIIALDLDTGKQQWIYQARKDDVYNMACISYLGFPDGPNCPENYGPDFDFGASVVITQDKNGKDLLLAAQKSGDVYALDPDNNGAIVWQKKLSDGTPVGGVHWGMAVAGQQVFVPVADPDWEIQGWSYKPQPGIAALDITTGKINWRYQAERGCDIDPATYNTTAQRHSEPWPGCHFLYGFSGAALAIDGAVLAGSLNGSLYAFDAKDGNPLWEYSTNKPFDTLNGVQAHGGALDNAGPVAGNGYLVLQSGYSYIKQMPGNVLLVFKKKSVE